MDEQSERRRPRVAVVFGGRSGEHAISCVTAAGVLGAIDRDRWDVVPVGVTTTGRFVLVDDDPSRLQIGAAGELPQVPGDGVDVLVPREVGSRALTRLPPGEVPSSLGDVDVVLPLLHGPYGEDGTLQGMLELTDVRYAGSGVLASAVAMDKHYAKVVLAGHGMPVGPYAVVHPRQWVSDPAAVLDACSSLGWPVFVKPARAGSSVGITRVTGPDELVAAIEVARGHDPKVLVEAAVVGREIECGVLGTAGLDGTPGAPEASLPGEVEVLTGHEFYDFEAKYLDESSVRLTCPADLPDDVSAQVRAMAVAAFEALGCEGLARVDFFVTRDGLVVNEVNTMPGFTPYSMFPRMWATSGLDYPALVDRVLRLALARPLGLR